MASTPYFVKSFALRKILVAVDNPRNTLNSAVRRAAQLAHRTGATIELLNVIPSRRRLTVAPDESSRLIRAEAAERLADLERMAKPLRREELIVETSVQSRCQVHVAILRRARIGGADLIVIDAHRHSQLARWLLHQTDIELIREAPIPLLIVKRYAAWRSPRVLAALDPMQAHDKARTLDDRIVQVASTLAAVLGGSLHLGHVCVPINVPFPAQAVEPGILTASAAHENAYQAHVRREVCRAFRPYGVPSGRKHLRQGEPATELPVLARSIKAGLVVMGAVSRSRLKRLLVGHTAERVLDALTCDVLIVKPIGNKSGLEARGFADPRTVLPDLAAERSPAREQNERALA